MQRRLGPGSVARAVLQRRLGPGSVTRAVPQSSRSRCCQRSEPERSRRHQSAAFLLLQRWPGPAGALRPVSGVSLTLPEMWAKQRGEQRPQPREAQKCKLCARLEFIV
ncbi:unnamed protein product [Coccothraustes coccothraustes]